MKLSRILVAAVILGTQTGLTGALAQDQEPTVDVKALLQRLNELEQKVKSLESKQAAPDQQRINELEQQVRILDRKRELADEASTEKAKTLPTVVVNESGLVARSADTNFVVALHGLVQVDNRSFFNDGPIQGNDGFLLRRARPIMQGTLYKDFDFMFVPDFGGSTVQIFDAYLNYRYQPWLQLRAGKFKTPVGLEYLQADAVTFFNERSLVTGLTPGRDVGFQLWGDIGGGVVSYAAGIFNGLGDARNSSNADFDDNREFAGRIFTQPFKKTKVAALQGLGLGVGGSFGNVRSNATGLASGYVTDGQQQFFTYNPSTTGSSAVANGDHWRISPQGYYYYGPFGVLAEYAISDQHVTRIGAAPFATANLQHTAWQVSGSWVLTGEDASFTGVTPRHAFDPRKGYWGAFQLVGRYAELDIDDKTFPLYANATTSASAAQAWSVGLNWYLNKNILVKASYSRTTFTGGGGAGGSAPAAVTRQPEEAFFTRLQLAF